MRFTHAAAALVLLSAMLGGLPASAGAPDHSPNIREVSTVHAVSAEHKASVWDAAFQGDLQTIVEDFR